MRRPVGLASALRAGIYIAHASSLSAALRGGALRAAASRPCLGTACRDLYRSRQQPDGCAPRGRTSCDGQSALPRHLRAGIYIAHASSLSAALRGGALRATASRPCLGTCVPGFISLTPAACRLRSAGAHFVRRPVGLASALRASDWSVSTTVIPVKTGIHCQLGQCMPTDMDSRFRGNDEGFVATQARKTARPPQGVRYGSSGQAHWCPV